MPTHGRRDGRKDADDILAAATRALPKCFADDEAAHAVGDDVNVRGGVCGDELVEDVVEVGGHVVEAPAARIDREDRLKALCVEDLDDGLHLPHGPAETMHEEIGSLFASHGARRKKPAV